jgi:hypothetical protein
MHEPNLPAQQPCGAEEAHGSDREAPAEELEGVGMSHADLEHHPVEAP